MINMAYVTSSVCSTVLNITMHALLTAVVLPIIHVLQSALAQHRVHALIVAIVTTKVLHNLAKSFSAYFSGVPIPTQHAAAGEQIEQAIQTALSEAQQKRITGSEITPYLLDRIQQLTHGASLTANIHLIKNNAKVGSQVAVALSKQQ